MPQSLIYITAASRDKALMIARILLEERLIACANVFDGATSIYRWEDRIEETTEAALIAKTASENLERLTHRVLEIHDYFCPCVVSIKIDGGNAAFLNWIDAETLNH